MILDIYFKRPIFWDYAVALSLQIVLVILLINGKISLPSVEDTYILTGELTNIALTMVGFILTILTVIITFKDNSSAKAPAESEEVFTKFFSTSYYYETVRHLKNCIKSISIIAALGFLLKLFLSDHLRKYLFFYNILGMIIIMMTVYRCLLILSKLLELQKTK